ncbi:hypothetical protein J6590_052198 [Homalodisca vitripennis]|nr:hypothetical protein J6590_052198 [Homalodisca vitripennis]
MIGYLKMLPEELPQLEITKSKLKGKCSQLFIKDALRMLCGFKDHKRFALKDIGDLLGLFGSFHSGRKIRAHDEFYP